MCVWNLRLNKTATIHWFDHWFALKGIVAREKNKKTCKHIQNGRKKRATTMTTKRTNERMEWETKRNEIKNKKFYQYIGVWEWPLTNTFKACCDRNRFGNIWLFSPWPSDLCCMYCAIHSLTCWMRAHGACETKTLAHTDISQALQAHSYQHIATNNWNAFFLCVFYETHTYMRSHRLFTISIGVLCLCLGCFRSFSSYRNSCAAHMHTDTFTFTYVCTVNATAVRTMMA